MKTNSDKDIKKHLKALKMLEADKFDVSPCKEFNPDCANCKFYVLEGLLSWYYDLLNENIS